MTFKLSSTPPSVLHSCDGYLYDPLLRENGRQAVADLQNLHLENV